MIEWSRVNELREEVGESDFKEVVDLFLEEVSEALDRLSSSQGSAEEHLHFLKGCALSLGFETLAQLCERYERQAAGAQPVDVSAIVACFDRSRSEFLSGLSRDTAA
ncbi:Hpt domain-containing protein [Jhaorihella thermophila]|uniref:Hpt domain-containing protein n=1 Tax=Jhaorihella thermophila TaxID=488547 RepID=A0A1H5VP08_9RHOB|nr:Hpt domain-containing protein [Jhaorihella thermophila]SEF88923.1 Hpt domain-containing protein [Jhaorihella thermophila]